MLDILFGGNGVFLALGGGLLAAAIAWLRGRATGARAERERRAAERLKSMTEAQKIDEAIAGRDTGENRKRLKQWGR